MAKGKPRGKPFEEGDKRINRRGRPKDHVGVRKLIQRIAWEPVSKEDRERRLELMVRNMMTSKNAADHESVLKHGYGDVPKEIAIQGDGLMLRVVYDLPQKQTDDDTDKDPLT